MERFVQLIVGGGLALVAGLWLVTLVDWMTVPWLAGVGLALFGVVGLSAGIWREIDV